MAVKKAKAKPESKATSKGTEISSFCGWDGDTLVFAEVKSLSSDTYSAPDRAIDRLKQELVVRTAIDYVRRGAAPWKRVRFDTVNVLLDHPPRISLRRDAFPPPAALRRAS